VEVSVRSFILIVGDASGHIREFDTTGKYRWQQFVGSSVGGIDLSANGRRLAVSTYAGLLSIFHLDAGRQHPHQIGNGNHLEEPVDTAALAMPTMLEYEDARIGAGVYRFVS
jgi:hypothetical protein